MSLTYSKAAFLKARIKVSGKDTLLDQESLDIALMDSLIASPGRFNEFVQKKVLSINDVVLLLIGLSLDESFTKEIEGKNIDVSEIKLGTQKSLILKLYQVVIKGKIHSFGIFNEKNELIMYFHEFREQGSEVLTPFLTEELYSAIPEIRKFLQEKILLFRRRNRIISAIKTVITFGYVALALVLLYIAYNNIDVIQYNFFKNSGVAIPLSDTSAILFLGSFLFSLVFPIIIFLLVDYSKTVYQVVTKQVPTKHLFKQINEFKWILIFFTAVTFGSLFLIYNGLYTRTELRNSAIYRIQTFSNQTLTYDYKDFSKAILEFSGNSNKDVIVKYYLVGKNGETVFIVSGGPIVLPKKEIFIEVVEMLETNNIETELKPVDSYSMEAINSYLSGVKTNTIKIIEYLQKRSN